MKVVMKRAARPSPSSHRGGPRGTARLNLALTDIEGLEGRTMLDASITISATNVLAFAGDANVDNVLTVSYAANVYTISDVSDFGSPPTPINIDVTNSSIGVIVNGSGTPTVTVTNLSSLSTAALNFNLGPQTNTINLQSINDPTTIDSMDAAVNTYNIGNSTNGVQGIGNTLTLQDTIGTAAVTIDDTADNTVQRSVTLSADNSLDTGSIVGLAPATINFVPTQLHSLDIRGNSFAGPSNVSANYTILGTPANVTTTINTADSSAITTNPSAGVLVSVQGTGQGSALSLVFQHGNSGVDIGSSLSGLPPGSGNVQGILGNVDLVQSGGDYDLQVDDGADTTARSVALSDTQLSGLAPGPINFLSTSSTPFISSIIAGSGGNNFSVSNTPSNLAFSLDAGSGANTVNISGVSGSGLSLVGQAGSNNVTIGSASGGTAAIAGPLSIRGAGPTVTPSATYNLRVDDASGASPVNSTLSVDNGTNLSTDPSADSGTLTGFGPAGIGFVPSHLSFLTISGGSGGNSFTVSNTPANIPTILNAGAGSATDSVLVTGTASGGDLSIVGQSTTTNVTLQNTSTSASNLQGTIVINPSGTAFGSTVLTVDDTRDTAGFAATLSATASNPGADGRISGISASPIVYPLDGTVSKVVLSGGSGADSLTVDFGGSGGNPIPTGGVQFDGGAGSNSLTLQGTPSSGAFTSEVYQASLSGSGTISLGATTIGFSGLSPITDTTPASNFSFSPPPSAIANVSITDGPMVPGGATGAPIQTATIADGSGATPPAFESINFANKTNVTINVTLPSGTAAVSLNNPTAATGLSSLIIQTSSSDTSDVVNVIATPAGVMTSVSASGQTNAINVTARGLAASPATFSASGGAANSSLNVDAGGQSGRLSVTSSAVTVGGQTFSYASEQAINFSNVLDGFLVTVNNTVQAVAGTPFTDAFVAAVNMADPYVDGRHFNATIDWGDGTTSAGTVGPGSANPVTSGFDFEVLGSHTYATTGSFPVTVNITTNTGFGGSQTVGGVTVSSLSFVRPQTAVVNSSATVTNVGGFQKITSPGPITAIDVSPYGEFQVFFQGLQNGQFFPSDQPIGDAGILIRLPDGTVDGFNLNGRESAAQSTHSIAFHPISQTLSPDGTTITTVFDNSTDNNSLGIRYRVTQVIIYHTGDPFFTATYQITDEGNQPLNLDVFQAGDLFLANSDEGVGFYNPQTGGIGGVDATGQFKIFFQPNSAVGAQPTNFEEDEFDTIWSVIGGGPTSNFNNMARLPSTPPPFNNDPNYIDNGAGLEWKSLAVPVGTPTSISAFTAFGNVSVVGPAGNMQVTNTSDSGVGSLRQAILNANAAPAGSSAQTITFNIPGSGPHVITMTSALPHITQPVLIDGTTQPGFAGVPLIEVSGASAGADADGFVLDGGNSTIRGLAINRFTGSGIVLEHAGGDLISGNYVGTDAAGANSPGNGVDGIEVVGSSSTSDSIVGNVIVGNQAGVYIFGGASGTTVAGNHIGVGLGAGSASQANQVGVAIADSPHNVIGGSSVAMANIIADNTMSGVLIFNSALGASDAATGNVVASNVIMDNGQNGVYILNASGNIVGMSTGTATSPGTPAPLTTGGNIIAANGFAGVQISVDNVPGSNGQTPTGAAASGNVVQNNLVTGNQHDGIYVFDASGNFIGNGQGGGGNTIDGSGFSGVHFDGAGATGNTATGNSIENSTKFGVQIDEGSGNTIGGTGSAANQILSSGSAGIQFLTGGQPSAANPTGGNTFAGSTSDSVEGPTQMAASVRAATLGVLSLRSGRRVPVVTKLHPAGPSLTHPKPVHRAPRIHSHATGVTLHAARLHR